MKKISILMAMVALLSMGFTSCKEDTQPRLQKPTEFVLNIPPMANQTIVLQSSDNDNTVGTDIDLTVSQPNYGLGTVTHYEVQVSYTPDFADYQPLYTVNTQAKIKCSSFDFAVAMNALNGITSKEDEARFDPTPRDTYVRVRAFVPNCDYSEIFSNVIKLNVQPFFAVRVPGILYVVGKVNGWDINSAAVFLTEPENGVGSKIYTGVIEMDQEQASGGFRFYTQLGDWETNSIGSQKDDQPIAVELDGGVYEGDAVDGKGSWQITNWAGGKLKITVDLSSSSSKKVIFEAVDEE